MPRGVYTRKGGQISPEVEKALKDCQTIGNELSKAKQAIHELQFRYDRAEEVLARALAGNGMRDCLKVDHTALRHRLRSIEREEKEKLA
jgi:hypothetical protein